jgi:hypothetical protein
MGTPTVEDLKAMIWMNLIKNKVVTTDDVNLATKAFDPDIGGMKNKQKNNQIYYLSSCLHNPPPH